jgi:hypothetical protein
MTVANEAPDPSVPEPTSVDWPLALIQELAERRVVIVIGAGVSATAVNDAGATPPTWRDLLLSLAERAIPDPGARSRVRDLVDAKRYPEAAQVARDNADRATFDLVMRDMLLRPGFSASRCHEDIMSLDAKVVVSLNFDKIYDLLCESLGQEEFVVTDYSDRELVNYLRSSRRIILKLHGTVDSPNRTILSRTQYATMKRENPEVLEIVRALLLTNTVLFLGCGFNGDPDIDTLLEENSLAVASAYPHYALVAEGEAVPEVRTAQGDIMNITFLEYSAPTVAGKPDHRAFAESVAELARRVLAARERAV